MKTNYEYFKHSDTNEVLKKQSFVDTDIDFPEHWYRVDSSEIKKPNLNGFVEIKEKTYKKHLKLYRKTIKMMIEKANQSPALVWMSNKKHPFTYPDKFNGKVPLKVTTKKNVYPDFVIQGKTKKGTECKSGFEYYCWVNSYGAVSAILANGEQLGLYPNEFEVSEYHLS